MLPPLGHSHDDSCCCESAACAHAAATALTRREFLTASGIALSAAALGGLSWNALAAGGVELPKSPGRAPLVVKPILTYAIPKRRPATSWRNWGGIQSEADKNEEIARINGELGQIKTAADFPVEILPVSAVQTLAEFKAVSDAGRADTFIIYAAGGGAEIFNAALESGKQMIFFLRHKSGPVSLWYEIISPRYLHGHTDELATKGVDNGDVVVDKTDELLWRLRALCGLKNVMGMKIVAIGGPAGWGPSGKGAPERAQEKWKLDISTVSYKELTPLLQGAMADAGAMKLARDRAAQYLKDETLKLETERAFVENAFLLEQVFRGLMQKAGAPAITVNQCMGTIMGISKTSACLALSLLNDDGYYAFCESDFVAIPSGMLLANISGRPHFINDPTYPHDGVITLAHCTAPRKMNGKDMEPVRLVTHFESDYGASPKVEMRKGQVVTNIIPDFAAKRYVGFVGEIVDAPFLPICRSQIDVAYKFPDEKLALAMPGFHWETCYGDYLKEMGYALKKIPIDWQVLA